MTCSVVLLWIKKNWKWVVLPVGVVLWLLGRASAKTKVVVASSELQGHAEVAGKLAAEAEHKKAQAAAVKDARDQKIQKDYEISMKGSTDAIRAETQELTDNPDGVNSYLKKVGRNVRGE